MLMNFNFSLTAIYATDEYFRLSADSFFPRSVLNFSAKKRNSRVLSCKNFIQKNSDLLSNRFAQETSKVYAN